MLDFREEQRLKKMYEEMSDDALLELASAKQDDYREGVYDLVIAEARKRGLEQRRAILESGNSDTDGFDPAGGEGGEIPDETQSVEVYYYRDNETRDRLLEFLREFNIAHMVAPKISIKGVPLSEGSIKVRADQVKQAKKIIDDFEAANEFPRIFMDGDAIKKSIAAVLNERGIADAEIIAEEIIDSLKQNKDDVEIEGGQ
jgi:hypothetical protein